MAAPINVNKHKDKSFELRELADVTTCILNIMLEMVSFAI